LSIVEEKKRRKNLILMGELAEVELSRRKLMNFSTRVYPGYMETRHHKFIAEILERAVRREKGWMRIVLHEPPQHGKSLQVSTLFPAFYLGHYPNDPIILTAYNDRHAETFSRRIRNIVNSNEYKTIFPGLTMSQDSRSVHRWEFNAPHRGEMVAAGIFGGITGKGARLMVIDDPIKNREEAESELYRGKLIEAWKSTLKTRLHDEAIVIVPVTRWHEKDLSGHLVREEGFRYICLPALAEKNDVLGRKEDEALWSYKFPKQMLEDIKNSIGEYNWSALYQGRPSPPAGLMFKREYFDIVDKVPERYEMSTRYWDLATSDSSGASYTCSIRAYKVDADIYLDSEIRGRWTWPVVRNFIKTTALDEKDVMVGIESQGPQKGMIQEIWSDPDLIGLGIFPVPVSSSKSIRALITVARGEAGRLHLVKGAWNDGFIQEHIQFPNGENDDRVDVVSGAIKMLGMSVSHVTDLNDYDYEDGGEEVLAGSYDGKDEDFFTQI